jgi:hypothetical protein
MLSKKSGSHSSSASKKATSSPFAFEIPLFLAAATPAFSCFKTLIL